MFRCSLLLVGAALWLGLGAPLRAGSIVRLDTPIGSATFELYDQQRPLTVQNFLRYIKEGRYQNSFAHRLLPGFVLQGGGFFLVGTNVDAVPAFGPIPNEAGLGAFISNAKGTITMAKVAGDPNSATSHWFVNLNDNNTGPAEDGNLDVQNGGFTAFGRIVSGAELLTVLNTDFADPDLAVRGYFDATGPLGEGFDYLPLLANELVVSNLFSTTWSIVSEEKPTVTLAGRPRLRGTTVLVRGRASAGVDAVEWRLNKGRRVQRVAASPTWSIRVTKLKPGRNLVEVRAVTRSGGVGNFRRIPVVRP